MLIEAIVLIGAFWLGLIPAGKSLVGWQHALMMPAMIIAMLFRLDRYTGRMGHPVGTPATAPGREAAVPQ
jgi:hypothetical protein